jgi:inner membrane protein
MPTIFSHALAASAAGQWWGRRLPAGFWTWTAVCAMLPDVDVIAFSFGVPYDDMFGHRGITHSVFFAAIAGAVVALHLLHRPDADSHRPAADSHRPAADSHRPAADSHRVMLLVLWFAGVTASHGLLDALTNGGRGIAFFAPFSDHRYFFPWRPIQVSPIGVGFFSARGLRVLASEAGWIWLPSAIIAVCARLIRRWSSPPSPNASTSSP